MEIIGTRGFKGKNTKNGRAMAAKHVTIEGNLSKDKPVKRERAKPIINSTLFEGALDE